MDIPSATRQLKTIFDCAREAGIFHATYINFGTLLGFVRDRALIPWDDDTDISVMSDMIKPKQEYDFYQKLCKANVFKYRSRRTYRSDIERALWFSCRSELHGSKSCIWFTFRWKNHLYHCKGNRWLKKIGNKPEVNQLIPSGNIHDYTTIMKGNSIECFKSLREVKFLGIKVNIPVGAGQLLDEYYPNWAIPKHGGASSYYRLVLIKKWAKKDSWMVLS